MKFRITYQNSFKELKTITIDEPTYYDALRVSKSMFGDSIVSVEEIDKPALSDYSMNMFDDESIDWLSD